MSYAIQADGLVKRFGETRALAGVSLTAEAGTVLGVLGPNGAGKTTATRILATLIEPTEGSARVGGYDVVKEAHKVRQLIGLTGQYAGVDEMLTGTENLILIGRLLGIPRNDTYNLYLSYYLGRTAYGRGSRGSAAVQQYARATDDMARSYAAQMQECGG